MKNENKRCGGMRSCSRFFAHIPDSLTSQTGTSARLQLLQEVVPGTSPDKANLGLFPDLPKDRVRDVQEV